MQKNIFPTLFDVKPKRTPGGFRVPEHGSRVRIINLRSKQETAIPAVVYVPRAEPQQVAEPAVLTTPAVPLHKILASAPVAEHKEILKREIERELASENNIIAQLAAASAAILQHPQAPKKEKSFAKLEKFWGAGQQPTAVHIVNLSPAARELELWAERFRTNQKTAESMDPVTRAIPVRSTNKKKISAKPFIIIGGIVFLCIAIILLVKSSGFKVQQHVIKSGSSAVTNLEAAKRDLESFNFGSAAGNFARATQNFDEASGTLRTLGASLLNIIGKIPGLQKVKAADTVVEAGRRISRTGEDLSRAFSDFQKTNFLAMIRPDKISRSSSLARPIASFKNTLESANKNIRTAQELLADVQDEALPPDKRELFAAFRDKIPIFESYISDAINYSDFLLKAMSAKGKKSYIVLLENNTELRPTGGFPGTYAVISFEKGALTKVFVDDIYNIDGQIKENIIPPIPLQHITPNWGMRDANWFADFPTSARKIQEFYQKDGGGSVDGVFAVNTSIIARLLEITGPIDMPEYGLTLDAKNFVAEVQDEVETKTDRAQPKRIVFDFQPRFFEKLAELPKEKLVDVFKVLLESLEQKHVLASFNDPQLQGFAEENGFSGEIKQTGGDYIQVAFSNVKGGKTDAVTTNSLAMIASRDGARGFAHTLTIRRTHTGGSSPFKFYNQDNPSYVKVYLPKGARFGDVSGNATPNYQPLVSYADLGFKKDEDLNAIESRIQNPRPSVDIFEETGRTVIGFWLIVKPQKTNVVTLSYHVPFEALQLPQNQYSLLWQKQSGTAGDLAQFSFTLPPGQAVIGHSPELQVQGEQLVSNMSLKTDQELNIVFKP